jgi:hypothetical protein
MRFSKEVPFTAEIQLALLPDSGRQVAEKASAESLTRHWSLLAFVTGGNS